MHIIFCLWFEMGTDDKLLNKGDLNRKEKYFSDVILITTFDFLWKFNLNENWLNWRKLD